MKIVYKAHLHKRLQEREIPKDYPRRIVQESESKYFDSITNRYIAIKKLPYKGKIKNMLVAYDIIDNKVELITIHPVSSPEIENKIASGRWKKYEEN